MATRITVKHGVTITLDQALTLSNLRLFFPEMRWAANECGCCVHAHTHCGDFLIGEDGGYDFFPAEGVLLIDQP